MSQPNAEDAETLTSGTAAGLYMFLDLAAKRGDLTKATAVALRTGSRKVLDIEGDEQLDLRKLDQDDLLSRFHRLSKADLNDQSRATYEGRFRKALNMYLMYLDDDPSWKPAVTKRSSTTKPSTSKTKAALHMAETPEAQTVTLPTTPPPTGMTEFPIPLRPGVQGKLILPDDLTQKEAKKVVAIVTALAIEEQLAITAGPSAE
ncbi:MAG: hypothetical protein M3257_01855 [Actinomycetota bacterium]|nr:hypothetical protein [Actinomycetota bacterium]